MERQPDAAHDDAGNDLLPNYPVAPVVPQPRKDAIVAISVGSRRLVVPIAELRDHVNDAGTARIALDAETQVELAFRDRPPVVWPSRPGATDGDVVVAIPAYRFAWYAMHPEDRVWTP